MPYPSCFSRVVCGCRVDEIDTNVSESQCKGLMSIPIHCVMLDDGGLSRHIAAIQAVQRKQTNGIIVLLYNEWVKGNRGNYPGNQAGRGLA